MTGPGVKKAGEPLVKSCKASGWEVYLQTYAEPPEVRLVFHRAEDVAEFARVVAAARKPPPSL